MTPSLPVPQPISLSVEQDPPAVPSQRGQRTDGAKARQCLLHAALRLFAEKGYAKTSIREIAQAAQANIASICYYFGDKAGLYRAAFNEPMGCTANDRAAYSAPNLSLKQALHAFISNFVDPMKQGEVVQQCTRLHFREMLEPTGLWEQAIHNDITPAHGALVGMLARHLGLQEPDDALHRLAFSITGLPLQLLIGRDCIQAICPALIAQPEAIDVWVNQMVLCAEAMVAIEAGQRLQSSGSATKATSP